MYRPAAGGAAQPLLPLLQLLLTQLPALLPLLLLLLQGLLLRGGGAPDGGWLAD